MSFPGRIVEVELPLPFPLVGSYRHTGLEVNSDGDVICASKEHGMVVLQSGEEFSGGYRVTSNTTIPADYSKAQEAVWFVYRMLGQPYNLFSANCEQLVRAVYGLPVESPQVQDKVLNVVEAKLLSSNNKVEQLAGLFGMIAHMNTPKDVAPAKRFVKATGFVLLIGALNGEL